MTAIFKAQPVKFNKETRQMADKQAKGYQEALRRIEENYKTKETELDLKGLELTELPPEIGKLKHLIQLNIGYDFDNGKSNSLKSLPEEIIQLTNLQTLYLHNNQLSELPKEITQLTNLQTLLLD